MTELQAACATTIAVVFGAAAIGKVGGRERFLKSLKSYGFADELAHPLSILVPIAEIACAVALWIPAARRPVGIATLALLGGFTALLAFARATGKDADCGCFGSATQERISWFSFVRNALLGAAATGVIVSSGSGGSLLPGILTGAGAGLVLLLVDQSMSLFTRYWIRADRVHAR